MGTLVPQQRVNSDRKGNLSCREFVWLLNKQDKIKAAHPETTVVENPEGMKRGESVGIIVFCVPQAAHPSSCFLTTLGLGSGTLHPLSPRGGSRTQVEPFGILSLEPK